MKCNLMGHTWVTEDGCNLKTMELLYCAVIGIFSAIRENTILPLMVEISVKAT